MWILIFTQCSFRKFLRIFLRKPVRQKENYVKKLKKQRKTWSSSTDTDCLKEFFFVGAIRYQSFLAFFDSSLEPKSLRCIQPTTTTCLTSYALAFDGPVVKEIIFSSKFFLITPPQDTCVSRERTFVGIQVISTCTHYVSILRSLNLH